MTVAYMVRAHAARKFCRCRVQVFRVSLFPHAFYGSPVMKFFFAFLELLGKLGCHSLRHARPFTAPGLNQELIPSRPSRVGLGLEDLTWEELTRLNAQALKREYVSSMRLDPTFESA